MQSWSREDQEKSAPKKGRDLASNAMLSCLLSKVSNSSSLTKALHYLRQQRPTLYDIQTWSGAESSNDDWAFFSVMHFGAL